MTTRQSPALRNTLASASSLLLVVSFAAAQPGVDRPGLNQPSGVPAPTFTRVEQTVEDVDPLGMSIRSLPADLRQPTGFRDVFRISGSAALAGRLGVPNTGGADLFARVDGAVTAVFPQSVYFSTRNGVMAAIPPGTIFFLGPLPIDRFGFAPSEPPPSPDRVDQSVDARVDSRADSQFTPAFDPSAPLPPPRPAARAKPEADNRSAATHTPIPRPEPAPGLMTDENVRRRVVRQLLMQAAEAAEARRRNAKPGATDASPAADKSATRDTSPAPVPPAPRAGD